MKTPKEIADYAALLNLDIPAGREKLTEAIAAAVAEAIKAEREAQQRREEALINLLNNDRRVDADTAKSYAAVIRARNGAK